VPNNDRWYHFLTSLVWHGPYGGLISRTRPLGYQGGNYVVLWRIWDNRWSLFEGDVLWRVVFEGEKSWTELYLAFTFL